MSTNKKDLLAKIKAAFLGVPIIPVAAADPMAPATATPVACGYPVDGGENVYTDISDDTIPGLDANDAVYSDEALTMPYPDGTYNITGTQFGFTVAGGVVTAINDPAMLGPGTPVPAGMTAPVTTPVLPAPTFEERLAALESKMNTPAIPTGMATEVQLQAATAKFEAQQEAIALHKKTITDLFEMVEQLLKEPTAEPVTLTDAQKAKFKKTEDRDARFSKYAEHMKNNKTLN